jgi:hypothetical protein
MMEVVPVPDNEQPPGPPALRPPSEPAVPGPAAPPSLDPEQVRQFQQFQQFQELMRQQGGTPLLPPARKPLWQRILRGKLIRKLAALAVVVLGLYFAYDYYFGDDSEDLPASETGGQTFTDRTMLQTRPHESVRMVYHRIADGDIPVACGQFTDEAARQFAADFDAPSCGDAVTKLHAQVIGRKNDYAEPVFPADVRNVSLDETVVEISSCRAQVTGGPRLGWFKVEKTPHKGQWIITAHRPETC